jgi:hypothetical protein
MLPIELASVGIEAMDDAGVLGYIDKIIRYGYGGNCATYLGILPDDLACCCIDTG